MSYQAVIRDANDDLVASSTIGMQISILQGSTGGTAVYVETHTPVTNTNGLVTIEIGTGTFVSGNFVDIDWSGGPYFLKTETDPAGGTTYTITGTSQLLSVPYALHAKTAENFTETDPVFVTSVAGSITGTDTTNWNNKLDAEVDGSVTNELQTISRTGLTVTLTDGGFFTDSVNVFNGDMKNQNIINLANPVNNLDAVTKSYVDALKARVEVMEDILIRNDLYKIKDVDGNSYNLVRIGDQLWMATNLRTTKYSEGTSIDTATNNAAWSILTTGAYCYYNNDSTTYDSTYGALYNWYAIADSRNLCPTGWHVPSDDEWTILATYLGGSSVAGGKMKETGFVHWLSPNTGATNESGFTALPGGYRHDNGTFLVIGYNGYWWSSTEYSATDAWYRPLLYNYTNISRNYGNKEFGLSVRCLKD